MKLKPTLTTLAELPQPYHALYEKQEDGTFRLSLEDEPRKPDDDDDSSTDDDSKSTPKGRLREFRDRNVALNKRIAALQRDLKKYEGIDPEKYKQGLEALDKLGLLDDQKLVDAGKIEDVIKMRTETMRKQYEQQFKAKEDALAQLTGERDKHKRELADLKIEREVADAVGKVGKLKPNAQKALRLVAREMWTLGDDGKIVPMENGELVYGAKGDVLTMQEWAEGLVKEQPFWFEPGSGSGAAGGKKGDTPTEGKFIDANDPVAFGKNAADIAKGKVGVR